MSFQNEEKILNKGSLEKNIYKKKYKDLKEKFDNFEDFMHSAFHDLKTPIFTTKGFLNILRENSIEKLSEDERNYLYLISNNLNNLENLINDIFEFFRCEKFEYKFEKLDVLEIINIAVERLEAFFEDEEFISLDYSEIKNYHFLHNKKLCVFGDFYYLTQVFINLLNNAIKYKKNEEKLLLKIGLIEKKEKYIFFVKDNGIGIDKKYHEFIFKYFNRLKEKSIEGTGMGLAIVRKIIEKHDGVIWLESKKAKGSTFYFSLPKCKSVKKMEK